MMKSVKAIVLCCMLFISSTISFAEDNCEMGVINSTDVQNSGIFYVVSTDAEQQIWQYRFAEGISVDTQLRIPSEASQLILSPSSNQIAYFLKDSESNDSNTITLRIGLLNIASGDDFEVFTGSLPYISQVVDLRWIDDGQLGFVSNGREQQYTIINLESSESENHQANIPIPQRDTVGESVRGDWHIEYNPDFSHAAFMDFRDHENNIMFWDLASGQMIDTEVSLPIGWIATNRAFSWINQDSFLIMNDENNWLKVEPNTNTVQQLTDIGEMYSLQVPIVAPEFNTIAFQVRDNDLDTFDSSVAIWKSGELIETCLNEESGQYIMNSEGWDSTSRYFAFTVFDYEEATTDIYVFDTEMSVLANIHSLQQANPKAIVIGWTEID